MRHDLLRRPSGVCRGLKGPLRKNEETKGEEVGERLPEETTQEPSASLEDGAGGSPTRWVLHNSTRLLPSSQSSIQRPRQLISPDAQEFESDSPEKRAYGMRALDDDLTARVRLPEKEGKA